jgi:hypothetical protein
MLRKTGIMELAERFLAREAAGRTASTQPAWPARAAPGRRRFPPGGSKFAKTPIFNLHGFAIILTQF